MGRGPKTKEENVNKVRPPRVSSAQGGTGGTDKGSDNSCLVSFSGSVVIATNNAGAIKQGDPVVIVPTASGAVAVDIFIRGKNFGRFSSRYTKKMLDCMSKRFTYEGTVESIVHGKSSSKIIFSIIGA